jgi:hypothetical protein
MLYSSRCYCWRNSPSATVDITAFQFSKMNDIGIERWQSRFRRDTGLRDFRSACSKAAVAP